MIDIVQTGDACTATMAGLQVSWRRQTDRWSHTIQFSAADDDCLSSAEGSPEDDFPASPAFQDLRVEARSNQICEFQLMGQSGGHLFSAAICCDAAQASVEFDICCRLAPRITPENILSTYIVGAGAGRLADAASPLMRGALVTLAGRYTLEALPLADELHAAVRMPATEPGGQLQIGCFEIGPLQTSARRRRVRWRYRLSRNTA